MKKINYMKLDMDECFFVIMSANRMFVSEINYKEIIFTNDIYKAIHFYNESTAYEICIELEVQTKMWFGVCEI